MDQVQLDLKRTHLTPEAQQVIADRIKTLFESYPHLNYYQGFHDVALNTKSYAQLEQLTLCALRDFMTPTLAPTLLILDLIPQILARIAPDFFQLVRELPPHYALAPVLTLFAHDTQNCSDILFHVQRHGLAYVLYLYAAVIIGSKEHVYKQLQGETEPEIVQAILTRTSAQIDVLNRQYLHKTAQIYIKQVPISSLQAYKQLSRYSAARGPLNFEDCEIASVKIGRQPSYAGAWTLALLVVAVAVQYAMTVE